MEPIFCAIHNKAMRQGKWGVSCPTPIEKDATGGVTKWCDYKPGKVIPKSVPTETREPIKQRDYDSENRGKVRNNLLEAVIQNGGLEATRQPGFKQEINLLVEYVMTGDSF